MSFYHLALGDSIIAGFLLPSPSTQAWPIVASARAWPPGQWVCNDDGIPGTKILDCLASTPGLLDGLPPGQNVDLVTLAIGHNDTGDLRSDHQLHYTQLLSAILGHPRCANAQVRCLEVFDCPSYPEGQAGHDYVNAAIRAAVASITDPRLALVPSQHWAPSRPDGVHPDVAGASYIADLYVPIMSGSPPSSGYHVPYFALGTTLTIPHTAGDYTLYVDAGWRPDFQPTPTTPTIVLVAHPDALTDTLILTDPTRATRFEVVGRDAGTLRCRPIDGDADRDFPEGSKLVGVLDTKHLTELYGGGPGGGGGQPLDPNLTAIAALGWGSGFLRAMGNSTWTLTGISRGDLPYMGDLYQPFDARINDILGLGWGSGFLRCNGSDQWTLSNISVDDLPVLDILAEAQPLNAELTAISQFATAAGGTGTGLARRTGVSTWTLDPLLESDVPAIPESRVTGLVTDLAAKAPLAAPVFTGRVTIPASISQPADPADDGSIVTLNLAANDWFWHILTGNRTIALASPAVGQEFTIALVQDATGSRTASWFAGITWMTAGGAAPTLATGANKVNVFRFKVMNTGVYYGFALGSNA